jgi:hypothetical protein
MTTTTIPPVPVPEGVTGADAFPPKCLRPGIWRHYAPDIEDVDLNGEEGVWHVTVTSGAGPVVGKLIRWVWADGEVGYEARIDGLEDAGGASDAAAFSVDSLSALECVLADLRYEWRCLLGEHITAWTYNFVSLWPNESYPDA